MTRTEINKLKVGDTILVDTFHYRDGKRKVKRKIVYIGAMGIGVRLFGWNPFYLRDGEIIEKVSE